LAPRRARAWLALFFVASVAGRLALGRVQAAPAIYSDELIFLEGGRSILRGMGLKWSGHPMYASGWLYPFIIAWPLRWLSLKTAPAVIRLINALMASATLFPAYGMARRHLSRRGALAVGALTLLIPDMGYVMLVMAENVYFPLAAAAFWAALAALERPTARRRLLAGALFGLLYHAKPQGLFYPIFFGLAVVADALTEPGLGVAERARRVALHWLTALGWCAVASARLAEAAFFEEMTHPLSLKAFLGNYASRALGEERPFAWGGFALMTLMNATVLAVACAVAPALRLAASIGPALAGRGERRWRQLALLTASATVVTVLASARHTVVSDVDWCVYERYLAPLLPPMFVLFLVGRPEALGPPSRPRLSLAVWAMGFAAAVAASVWLARWRYNLLSYNIPALAGWYMRGQYGVHMTLGRWLMAAMAATGPLGALAWAVLARRARMRWPRPRSSHAAKALAMAWLMLTLNVGFYVAQGCVVRPITREARRFGERVRDCIPKRDRLVILLDDMSINDFFQANFQYPAKVLQLAGKGRHWFAEPASLTIGGQILAPNGQQGAWLLASAKLPIVGRASRRIGECKLYDLAASPPPRLDWGRLRAALGPSAPDRPLLPDDSLSPSIELTWLRVDAPTTWRSGQVATINLRMRNDGTQPLTSGAWRCAIGYHWSKERQKSHWHSSVWDDNRHACLPEAMPPGAVADLRLEVMAPPNEGDKDWFLSLAPLEVGSAVHRWAYSPGSQMILRVRLLPPLPQEKP
jgi:hypothetical protein